MEKLEINNTDFVNSIKNLRENPTQENQGIMLGKMMQASFLNPTTLAIDPSEDGKINIPVGTKISFYTIMNSEKQKFALAFTDNAELEKWYQQNLQGGVDEKNLSRNSAVMGFMDYAKIVLDENESLDGMVINPYTENIVFNREQMASLREQRINKEKYGISLNRISKNEQIGLRTLAPEEYPTDLIDGIIDYAKQVDAIDTVNILMMKKQEKEGYLIVVDFKGEMNVVLGELAKVVKPYLQGEITNLDLVPLESPLGKEAVKFADQVYNKKGIQMYTGSNITNSELIEEAIDYTKEVFSENKKEYNEEKIIRILNLAATIAVREKVESDIDVIKLAAVLHDLDVDTTDFVNTKKFLKVTGLDEAKQEKVCEIISNVSWDWNSENTPDSIEGQILQDSIRLDEMGAIGIAKNLTSGNNSNDKIDEKEMFEKITMLKDKMNTLTAKRMAHSRYIYMEGFMKEMNAENNGDK